MLKLKGSGFGGNWRSEAGGVGWFIGVGLELVGLVLVAPSLRHN